VSVRHANLATVMISVPAREEERARTVAALTEMGLPPTVTVSPHGAVPCERLHGDMARSALRDALRPGCDAVLFVEDDVDVSPSLPDRLPQIAAHNQAVTLYLPGSSFYDSWGKRMLGLPSHPFGLGRVANLANWYGSQALFLPRDVALSASKSEVPRGFDIILRETLRRIGLPLFYAMPNLVQHRGSRSATSTRYKFHRSISFECDRPQDGPDALQAALFPTEAR
jgi:hypothetical protein